MQVGKKMRYILRIIVKRAVQALLAICILAAAVLRFAPKDWAVRGCVDELLERMPYFVKLQDTIPDRSVSGQLTVEFIDVGQGSCVLVALDGHAMLYDCGPEEKGTYLQNYLQTRGIQTLDYVVGSHPDADHIGGMDVVLTKFDCRHIFLPDIRRDTVSYRNVEEALWYRGYESFQPGAGSVYEFGDAQFTVMAPLQYYPEETNNNSIVIRLKYGSISFLFTGDAQTEEEADLLESGAYLSSTVYLVGHHGSSNASSEDFLRAVHPQYAIISCGTENDYGHPHEQVLRRLQGVGSTIYRTDLQGTIRAICDGESLIWEEEKHVDGTSKRVFEAMGNGGGRTGTNFRQPGLDRCLQGLGVSIVFSGIL